MNKLHRRKDESIYEWQLRIGSVKKKLFHVIRMDYFNRKLRIGFGFNEGELFFRLDLWWIGFRISK